MTVLKDKMLVRFEFNEDGSQVVNTTEFFNYQWGRLRDICVSDDGKIYLATNGSSWPSQPPNEIIELSNPNFTNTFIDESYFSNNIKIIKANDYYKIQSPKCNFYVFDAFGRLIKQANNKQFLTLDFSEFAFGVYSVVLKKGGNLKTIKIVI